MKRLFLIDDHEIVRHGLRSLLEQQDDLEVVGAAGTARDGVAGVLETEPDVTILDVRLPDGSGIDVARELAERLPTTRIMVLTSHDGDQTLQAAFAAGVIGYVLKEVRGEMLVDAVRAVADGRTFIDPTVAGRLMESVRREPAPEEDLIKRLSAQEARILRLIGDGMTNRQIGECLYLSEKTIKNNVTRILGKLGIERRTQAAVLASRLTP